MEIEVKKISTDTSDTNGRVVAGVAMAIWKCVQMGGGTFELPRNQRNSAGAISHFMEAAGIGCVSTRNKGGRLYAFVTVIRADNG